MGPKRFSNDSSGVTGGVGGGSFCLACGQPAPARAARQAAMTGRMATIVEDYAGSKVAPRAAARERWAAETPTRVLADGSSPWAAAKARGRPGSGGRHQQRGG